MAARRIINILRRLVRARARPQGRAMARGRVIGCAFAAPVSIWLAFIATSDGVRVGIWWAQWLTSQARECHRRTSGTLAPFR